mgnify:FL=1
MRLARPQAQAALWLPASDADGTFNIHWSEATPKYSCWGCSEMRFTHWAVAVAKTQAEFDNYTYSVPFFSNDINARQTTLTGLAKGHYWVRVYAYYEWKNADGTTAGKWAQAFATNHVNVGDVVGTYAVKSSDTVFAYDPSRNRYKQVTDGKATLYVGGLYERQERTYGIRYQHYIKVGSQTIAINTVIA